MRQQQILHMIAAEDFDAAATEVAAYLGSIDCTRIDEVQLASQFFNEAVITAKSIRAHQAGQASQLASAKAFLSPLLEPPTVNLMG